MTLLSLDPSAMWRADAYESAALPRAVGIQWLSDEHPPRWTSTATASLVRQDCFHLPQGLLRACKDLMLPEAHNLPPHRIQCSPLDPVPVDVLPELSRPEACPRSRADVVLWTAVPEAAVYKNDGLAGVEDQVRSPRKPSCMQPVSKSTSPQ
jgi:hypothetical protein